MNGHDTCLAHADEATREASGFTREAGKLGGRPPKPKPFDVWREQIESDFDAWKRPYEDALRAQRDNGSPDHPTRMKAADAVLDRVYGKPTTRTELSSSEDGAVTIATLAAAALRVLPPGIEIIDVEHELTR